MNAYVQWQEANDRWLADALADLRARLERMAVAAQGGSTGVPAPRAPTEPPATGSRLRRMFARRAETARTPDRPVVVAAAVASPETAGPAGAVVGGDTDETARGGDEPVPALPLLARRLGLDMFERHVLLLCAAMELDTRTGARCARAQGDVDKPFPTFGLALALFDDAAWDAMSPQRPLRYWRLLEIHQPAAQPLIGAALHVDERIVDYLKGANHLDDRLAPLLQPVPAEAIELPPSQHEVAETIVLRLRASAASARPPPVQLAGSDGDSKLLVAQTVAGELGIGLYRIGMDAVPTGVADQENLSRLLQREYALLPMALYVDATDADRTSAQGLALQHLLARLGGVVLVDVREPWPQLAADTLVMDVAKPTAAEQKQAWIEALGADHAALAARPALHFNFGVAAIRRLAADALAVTRGDPEQLPQVLWRDCIARARPALERLAQPVDAKATWDDLQLPAEEMTLLHRIADQVEHRAIVYDDWGFRRRMNRGFGISVLFAGESGTGKTMAAEVIANALGLSLYRIDLSAVVDKYIGETEKNLRRLFDAAEEGGCILLFDEADALFGKRSEVKDSHDRYSNIEVNYLLQRMEGFGGLAILATNMKTALDGAFLRRLRFIVKFPFPGVAERRAIWARAFPVEARPGVLDLDRLARFALSGGSIQNIAMNAAFAAAAAGTQLSMPLLLDAVRAEFRKLDKPVNENDLRWLESAGGQA
jgi:hypothetical protein